MKIIVDGADGTGKSTVVEFLAKKYNCDVIHMTKWGSRDPNDYVAKLDLNNIVSDRSFLSEMVYKQAFGLIPAISFGTLEFLLNVARKKGWKFITLTGPIETIKRRLVDRGDESPEIIKNIGYIDYLYLDKIVKEIENDFC